MSNRMELHTFYSIATKEEIDSALVKLRKILEIHFDLKDENSKDSSGTEWYSFISLSIDIKEIQEMKEQD